MIKERRESCRSDPAFPLAVLYTFGFFAFLMRLTFTEIPQGNKEMVNQIIPILGVIQAGIIQYFYQKSKEAQQDRQTDTINKLASTAGTVANTTAVLAGVPADKLPAGNAIPPVAPTTTTANVDINAQTVNVNESPEGKK